MLTTTLIKKNNSLKNININPLRLEDCVDNKGTNDIEQLHIFHYENLKVIYYGWTEGKEEDINQHELPEPIDNQLYYGDIIVLLRENNELINFPIEDYEEFYEYIFDGFDSCESDGDEILDEDEYDYSDGFIIKDE